MTNRRLVFRKTPAARPPSDTGGPLTRPGGNRPPTRRPGSFARVFGALKGTIRILPGTRLTEPIGEDWDAAR